MKQKAELKNYIGNMNDVNKLHNWLDQFFNSPSKKLKKFVIIEGSTGNGKTFLVRCMANEFGVDLHRITPDKITMQEKAMKVREDTMVCDIDGTGNKIVLFDDFDSCPKRIMKLFYDLYEECPYPIIFVCKEFYPLDISFKSNALDIHIDKPSIKAFSADWYHFLVKKAKELQLDIDDKTIKYIVRESPSVRSSINALYTGNITQNVKRWEYRQDIINDINNRCLKKDIDSELLHFLLRKLDGYDDNSYYVRNRLNHFYYMMKVQYKQSIDSFLVNNMIEPIENVKFNIYKKKINLPSKKKIVKPKKKKEKIVKKKEEKIVEEPVYEQIDWVD